MTLALWLLLPLVLLALVGAAVIGLWLWCLWSDAREHAELHDE